MASGENPIGGRQQLDLQEGINGNDQEWQHVQNRNAKQSSKSIGSQTGAQATGGNIKKKSKTKLNLLERMSMSFFLTNFPRHVTAKDLWDKCSKRGTVVDVFIPNRLSKAGRRFGFVKFIKVDNAARLLSDLKDIWFGNYLVYADVVKYSRQMGTKSSNTNVVKEKQVGRNQYPQITKNFNGGVSYAEAVKGKAVQKETCINSGNISTVSNSYRIVNVATNPTDSPSKFEKSNNSVLAKIIDPVNIPKAGQWLIDEGFYDFKISYVGGHWVFIVDV